MNAIALKTARCRCKLR